MQVNPFTSIVHTALAVTPIFERLATTGAVVLERLARGGGATNWYYCADKTHLQDVETKFRPGSLVSFYFDDRIRSDIYSPKITKNVEKIIVETGEAIIGFLRGDGIHVDMDIMTGQNELIEFLSPYTHGSRVFYGVFPARDNDGVRAITVTLPDTDGIVRPHPH